MDASTGAALGDGAARTLSIIGHPFVLMPIASVSAAHGEHASATLLAAIGAGVVALVACLLTWTIVQVRRGRWQHLDASARSERAQLNRVLLLVFIAASLACAVLGELRAAIGLLCAAAIIAAAIVLAGQLKLSLHVAFAALAAFVCGHWPLGIALAVLTLALGWARVRLGRHAVIDVVIGAIVGALAGSATLFA